MNREEKNPKSYLGNFIEKASEWFVNKDKVKWMSDMKKSIGLIASIIATLTFSLAINPPGGVVQAGLNDVIDKDGCSINNNTDVCVGRAALGIYISDDYVAFLACNTICFFASLTVCMLFVSGIPITNSFTIWLSSIGMCIALTTLALTYLFAASMVTPNTVWNSLAGNVFGIIAIVWVAIVVIVAIFLIVRLFVRCVKKCNCYKTNNTNEIELGSQEASKPISGPVLTQDQYDIFVSFIQQIVANENKHKGEQVTTNQVRL